MTYRPACQKGECCGRNDMALVNQRPWIKLGHGGLTKNSIFKPFFMIFLLPILVVGEFEGLVLSGDGKWSWESHLQVMHVKELRSWKSLPRQNWLLIFLPPMSSFTNLSLIVSERACGATSFTKALCVAFKTRDLLWPALTGISGKNTLALS